VHRGHPELIAQSRTTQVAERSYCKRMTHFLPGVFEVLLEADGHPQKKAEVRMNFIIIASHLNQASL